MSEKGFGVFVMEIRRMSGGRIRGRRTERVVARGAAIFLALALVAPSVSAQDSASRPTLPSCSGKLLSRDALRALALASSPVVAEIDREYAAELARAVETETLQNPELQAERTFTRMNIGGANDPQAQVSLGQPLRLSNFGSRARVAALLERAGEQRKRVKLFGLMQRLSLQLRMLEGYQRSLAIVKEARVRAEGKVSLIREGTKKGLLSRGDERLFEGEMYRLLARERGISARVALVESELARAIGVRCTIVVGGEGGPGPLPSVEALIEKAKKSTLSDQARVDILRDLSNEQVRLAELDRTPQITPRLMYQHTNDGGDFVGVGVSIPLPIWNQNQAETMRAAADSKVAQLQAAFIEDGALAEQISRLRIAAVNAHEQAALFDSKVIPAFQDALTFEEKRYGEGRGNLLQVWQTLRALNDVRSEGLELALAAAAIRSELSILIGEEI